MITAPYQASTAQLLATGQPTLEYTIQAQPISGDPFPLAVVGGSLSMDDTRSPRVTASIDVAMPTAAQRALLDPRQRPRVVFTATYVSPSGMTRDGAVVADLHLRNRQLRRRDGVLTLELASDEALIIDAAPNSAYTILPPTYTGPYTETKTDGQAWISTNIKESLAWSDAEYAAGSAQVVITGTRRAVDWPVQVKDMWDAISDAADQLDVDVYDAGDRIFRIAPRVTVAAEEALRVAAGDAGLLLDADSGVTRDDWANFVSLRYEYNDQVVIGQARVSAGPFAVGTVGYKILGEVRDQASTQTAANAAAATILGRMLARSRGLRFQVPPAWWVRPGHTIIYVTESGTEQRHIVSSIEHDLEGMTMSVTTRLPDTDSTIGT